MININVFRKNTKFLIDQVDHAPFKVSHNWEFNTSKGCFEKITPVWGIFRRATKEEQKNCSHLIFAMFDSPQYRACFYTPEEIRNSIKAMLS
jgi:hypothetical protein